MAWRRQSTGFVSALLPRPRLRCWCSPRSRCWTAFKCRSEIRFDGLRDGRVDAGIIFVEVFGADHFPQFAERTLIGDKSRPWHGEHARVLDSQFDLQSFALVIGVEHDAVRIGPGSHAILAIVAPRRLLRGVVVD